MPFWTVDETHAPDLESWVESANGHADFPIQNLPYGVVSIEGTARIAVAIGDMVLDLAGCARSGLLPDRCVLACQDMTLNRLLSLPAADRRILRSRLSELLSTPRHRPEVERHLRPATDCMVQLPMTIGDYTDFYVGIHHANNVGRQFRPDNPLLPNYKYVPIGYHGRASTIRPTGIPVRRPCGQQKAPDATAPVFAPTKRLDYELELGVWIGSGNRLGEPIAIGTAHEHIAGFSLLNDWSARDLQAWEYQPLGPFLAKNFHTTLSPWIVTSEALAPFRIPQPARPDGDPAPLNYLADEQDQTHGALSIRLEVLISSKRMREMIMPAHKLSSGPASNMYWTVQQIVAHHASNGCSLQSGDLLGTGTISASTRDGFGSLLELTVGGKEPITLPTGEKRCFLEDGDELELRGTAHAPGYVPIGFGECCARILPAPAIP